MALVGEALLAVAGLAWIRVRELPLRFGDPLGSVLGGTVVAIGLAVVNLGLLRYGGTLPLVRSVRRLTDTVLRPLFARVGLLEILLISAAAGFGEELLFRGAIQRDWGLLPASLLFGVAHLGGSGTLVFGAWAGVMGLLLGWLARLSGGLLAPIVAHALYDALALAYLRWSGSPEGSGE